jgi:hypothetical protein
MISDPLEGITCPPLPTLSDIQRRIAELASVQQQIDARTQLQSRSAPRTPPLPSAPPHPILGEAALYGVAQYLHPTEAHNGFANRCLWTAVQRSQCLPDGGNLGAHELSSVAAELRRALDWAHNAGSIRLTRDDQARDFWHECYPALSQVRPACPGEPWGLYGAATSRAEAQVLRLSAIYSILDCSPIIGLPHLQAALAVWNYCSAGASVLFGTSTGDPTADRIWEAINASSDGLSRKQISARFHGHLSSDRIEEALEKLISLGAIQQRGLPSGGRPSTLWSAIPEAQSMGGEETADESTTEDATKEESMQEESKFA